MNDLAGAFEQAAGVEPLRLGEIGDAAHHAVRLVGGSGAGLGEGDGAVGPRQHEVREGAPDVDADAIAHARVIVAPQGRARTRAAA